MGLLPRRSHPVTPVRAASTVVMNHPLGLRALSTLSHAIADPLGLSCLKLSQMRLAVNASFKVMTSPGEGNVTREAVHPGFLLHEQHRKCIDFFMVKVFVVKPFLRWRCAVTLSEAPHSMQVTSR